MKQLKPGSVDDRLLSSIDFGPTMLSIAGVPVPAHMQGIPFLGDQAGKPHDAVYAARNRFDESLDMVRSVRTKNICTYVITIPTNHTRYGFSI